MSRREWVLRKESELRCLVRGDNRTITVRLLDGHAELFGAELAKGKEYHFRDQNIAIFTWYGCVLETISTGDLSPESMYEADTTPMIAYMNTHQQLEARRDVALANGDNGPHVLIVGPQDHGKTTLARMLTTYAARLDRNPIYVDLDINAGIAGVPGSISALPIEKANVSVEDGFTNFNALTYFYGHSSIKENSELFKVQASILAKRVRTRLDNDADAKASGIIVDTFAYMDWSGLDVILGLIKDFEIDVILVMGHDQLFASLQGSLEVGPNGSKPVIVNLPVSGGKVQRDIPTRKRLWKLKFDEYFYGKVQGSGKMYQPNRMDGVDFSEYTFMQFRGMRISDGMRMVGDKASPEDAYRPTRISRIGTDLEKSILAVLHAPNQPLQTGNGELPLQFLQSNVAGYIYVVKIHPDTNSMDILSPNTGQLPTKFLLVGTMKSDL